MEQSFEDTPAASSPPKKKRGRPKKADKVLMLQSEATPVVKDSPKLRKKKKKGPAKSVSVSGKKKKPVQQQVKPLPTKPLQSDGTGGGASVPAEQEESAANVKVGQSVHGVVDGSFDAGYLVTVRVGDSETVFRGVVFGPGLSLPLDRENDVAPKMKRMVRDEALDGSASSASMNEEAIPSIAAAPMDTTVPASIPSSSPAPPGNEAHLMAAVAGSTGMAPAYQAPVPVAPSSAAGSYTPQIYRSPSFAQSPMHSAPGGFYYAAPPTHVPSPNANHGQGGYYTPRGFPYPFHFPRAEYGGSTQYPGPLPTGSPSPSVPGNLPPRAT